MKVLVTGATGFLGGRLVECMLGDPRFDLVAMAHRPGRAVRLVRHQVAIAWADLLDPSQLAPALVGVDAVVHCAYGADANAERAVTVDGTRNMALAAERAGVRTFVHISTIAVHSYCPSSLVSENSPLQKTGDAYCDAKIAAEEAVRSIRPDAVVLRMGNIYGPFSAPWTVRPLNHLREGRICLVDGGEHPSNMVYVDNAVDTILRALLADKARGETLFVVDDVILWRGLYDAYADWLGCGSPRSADFASIRRMIAPRLHERVGAFLSGVSSGILLPTFRYAAFRAAVSPQLGPLLSRMWQAVPPRLRYRIVGDPLGRSVPAASAVAVDASATLYPPAGLLAAYACKVGFSNAKMRDVLGPGPAVDAGTALRLTREWAEWARLVPSSSAN